MLCGETGIAPPAFRSASGVEKVAAQYPAHMDKVFDQQGVASIGIKDVMGLIAEAAQARFDFRRGGADIWMTHEQRETFF